LTIEFVLTPLFSMAQEMVPGTVKKMRLQVYLAHAGLCSRRQAKEIILKGNVKVDGKIITQPGFPVDPKKSLVKVGQQIARLAEKKLYLMLNKPKGYITTSRDRHAPKSVMDLVPRSLGRVYPVGRLDKDTCGLLLLTNDGELSYRLLHPRFQVEKVYQVEIAGSLRQAEKEKIEKGFFLVGKKTAPCRIEIEEQSPRSTVLKIALIEGRKRQIRLSLAHFGHRVLELKRIAMGNLKLGDLKEGQWRFLKKEELARLKQEGKGYSKTRIESFPPKGESCARGFSLSSTQRSSTKNL
jgi:pseudouridine synthase